MTYKGIVVPTNAICMGDPNVQELEVETATNMIPGRLVKRGTGDHQIVVCDVSGNPLGWLGYEQANPEYKPTTLATAYAANDMAPVLSGPGTLIVAHLASGQNVVKDAHLTRAASGELTAGTDGTDHIYAIAEESVNASGGAANILVRSLI